MKSQAAVVFCSALVFACAVCACNTSNDTPPTDADAGGDGGDAGNANLGGNEASDTAEWPVPNSPGLGLPNPQSYDATTTPGVVHDLVTGLDWLQEPGSELYPRADAIAHCSDLAFGGFDDWRVPAFIELVSLFNVVPNESDPQAFVYLSPTFEADGRFWSTSAVNKSGLGRLLDFTADDCSSTGSCSIGVAGKADEALGGAWCVRNGQPPATSPRYESHGTSVTDLRTGLIWLSVQAKVQTGAFADAVGVCEALGSQARLPSVTELLSIVVPFLDSNAFPDWPADAFAWTSSTVPARPGAYWAAAIGGATQADDASTHNRVQCVRSALAR